MFMEDILLRYRSLVTMEANTRKGIPIFFHLGSIHQISEFNLTERFAY